ncbi:Kinase OS=Streptomyces antimycoticus OX=68175 GN=SSPO_032140 PE=3 SV=1 [Streptomyces antimycoticus]
MAGDSRDAASHGPSPEWLDHARTPAARIAINRWLAAHPAPQPAQHESREPEAESAATLSGQDAQGSQASQGGETAVPAAGAVRPEAGIIVDRPGATVRLARCCTPVPPDPVTGFAVRGGAVTVHRERCPGVARMIAAGRTVVGVRWADEDDGDGGGDYRVTLFAEAFSRPHLLADLTEAIAAEGAEVVAAAVEPPREQRVRHTYTLQLPDASRLPTLMRAMRNVPGVYDVTREGRSVAAARS